jgi:hypothetical protein
MSESTLTKKIARRHSRTAKENPRLLLSPASVNQDSMAEEDMQGEARWVTEAKKKGRRPLPGSSASRLATPGSPDSEGTKADPPLEVTSPERDPTASPTPTESPPEGSPATHDRTAAAKRAAPDRLLPPTHFKVWDDNPDVFFYFGASQNGTECIEWEDGPGTARRPGRRWLFNSWSCHDCERARGESKPNPKNPRQQLPYASTSAKSDHQTAHRVQKTGQSAEERGEDRCTNCSKAPRGNKEPRACTFAGDVAQRCAECILAREKCSYVGAARQAVLAATGKTAGRVPADDENAEKTESSVEENGNDEEVVADDPHRGSMWHAVNVIIQRQPASGLDLLATAAALRMTDPPSPPKGPYRPDTPPTTPSSRTNDGQADEAVAALVAMGDRKRKCEEDSPEGRSQKRVCTPPRRQTL